MENETWMCSQCITHLTPSLMSTVLVRKKFTEFAAILQTMCRPHYRFARQRLFPIHTSYPTLVQCRFLYHRHLLCLDYPLLFPICWEFDLNNSRQYNVFICVRSYIPALWYIPDKHVIQIYKFFYSCTLLCATTVINSKQAKQKPISKELHAFCTLNMYLRRLQYNVCLDPHFPPHKHFDFTKLPLRFTHARHTNLIPTAISMVVA